MTQALLDLEQGLRELGLWAAQAAGRAAVYGSTVALLVRYAGIESLVAMGSSIPRHAGVEFSRRDDCLLLPHHADGEPAFCSPRPFAAASRCLVLHGKYRRLSPELV